MARLHRLLNGLTRLILQTLSSRRNRSAPAILRNSRTPRRACSSLRLFPSLGRKEHSSDAWSSVGQNFRRSSHAKVLGNGSSIFRVGNEYTDERGDKIEESIPKERYFFHFPGAARLELTDEKTEQRRAEFSRIRFSPKRFFGI